MESKNEKKKATREVADLSDQLRKAPKIAEATQQKFDDHRQHGYLEHLKEKRSGRGQQTQQSVEFLEAGKGLFSEWNSWFVYLSHK